MAATGRATIRRLVTNAGGVSAFARQVKVSREIIYRWLRSGRVPLKRVPDVIRASGGTCTARELRPDIAELLR